MKKSTLVISAVVAVAVLGGGGYLGYRYFKGAEASPTATLATAKVEPGLLRLVVASNGPVFTNQDVPIKCKASGTVVKLPFDVSDRVKKGDLLIQLDTEDQDRAVAKAKAALEAATAQLEQAKQDLLVSRQSLVVSRMKAEAALINARAKQKDAHAKLDRQQALLEKKLASPEEVETATTTAAAADADLKNAEAQVADIKTQELALALKEEDVKVQQANVDQNKVNLAIQEQQLSYATVVSPIDGVVSSLVSGKDSAQNDIITRIGSIVQSGTSSVSGGTTVMTVSDHSRIYVYANIPESDIGKVVDPQLGQPGQKVRITADAYPDEVFEGHVVRVADQGTVTSNVVNFEVRIEVDSPNKQLLKPKMTANVEVIIAEKPDVLLLPMNAFVRKRPMTAAATDAASAAPASTGQSTTTLDTAPSTAPSAVADTTPGAHPRRPRSPGQGRPSHGTVTLVKADGTTETRDVTVGLSDNSNYEVLSGLAAGDTVVLNKAGGESRWRAGGMGMMGGGRR